MDCVVLFGIFERLLWLISVSMKRFVLSRRIGVEQGFGGFEGVQILNVLDVSCDRSLVWLSVWKVRCRLAASTELKSDLINLGRRFSPGGPQAAGFFLLWMQF